MASRSDIDVDFEISPRLANITSTSDELTVQDAHDTLTDIEDSNYGESGHQFSNLISTEGGQSLEGGVFVGLTTALQDLQIAPDSPPPRTTKSTVTTGDTTGKNVIDSTATFVTDSVARGDWLFNWTDNSVTEVLSVQSETQLTTRGLRNGIDNQFDVADEYTVWEVRQFNLGGGNFTAVDESQSIINPYFTVFGIFGTRTASSSATTQQQLDIEYASFGGGVTIDENNSSGLATAGTTFPAGTGRQPCLLVSDALTIANLRGFNNFFVRGDLVLDNPALDLGQKGFIGESAVRTMITIDTLADVNNCRYSNATITGVLDGESTIEHSEIGELSFFSGLIQDSLLLAATITLGGGGEGHFFNCGSSVAGAATPTIDCGGSGQGLIIRGYDGGMKITNMTGGSDNVSIDMSSGQVIVDDTVTSSNAFILRGVGKWTNKETYSGGATITDELVDGRMINGLWTRFGLNPEEPVTITQSSITSSGGTVNISVTGDGVTSDTLTST